LTCATSPGARHSRDTFKHHYLVALIAHHGAGFVIANVWDILDTTTTTSMVLFDPKESDGSNCAASMCFLCVPLVRSVDDASDDVEVVYHTSEL
jgi:hypothetical protein